MDTLVVQDDHPQVSDSMDYCVPNSLDHSNRLPVYIPMRQESVPAPFYSPLNIQSDPGENTGISDTALNQDMSRESGKIPDYLRVTSETINPGQSKDPKTRDSGYLTPVDTTTDSAHSENQQVKKDQTGQEGRHLVNTDNEAMPSSARHNVRGRLLGSHDTEYNTADVDNIGQSSRVNEIGGDCSAIQDGVITDRGVLDKTGSYSAEYMEISQPSVIGGHKVVNPSLSFLTGSHGNTSSTTGNHGNILSDGQVNPPANSGVTGQQVVLDLPDLVTSLDNSQPNSPVYLDLQDVDSKNSPPSQHYQTLGKDPPASTVLITSTVSSDSTYDKLHHSNKAVSLSRRLLNRFCCCCSDCTGKKCCWIILAGVIVLLLAGVALALGLILTKQGSNELLSEVTTSADDSVIPSTSMTPTMSSIVTTQSPDIDHKDQEILELKPSLYIPLNASARNLDGTFPTNDELINLDVTDPNGSLQPTQYSWLDGVSFSAPGPVVLNYTHDSSYLDLNACVLRPALCTQGWTLSFVIQNCDLLEEGSEGHILTSLEPVNKTSLFEVLIYQQDSQTRMKVRIRLSPDRFVEVDPHIDMGGLCFLWLHVVVSLSPHTIMQGDNINRILRVFFNGTEPTWGNSYSSQVPLAANEVYRNATASLQLGSLSLTSNQPANQNQYIGELDDVIFFEEYKDTVFIETLYSDVYLRHIQRHRDYTFNFQ